MNRKLIDLLQKCHFDYLLLVIPKLQVHVWTAASFPALPAVQFLIVSGMFPGLAMVAINC